LTERGAYREALPLLTEVVDREPDNAFEHFYYAVALAATGHREEARGAAKKAVALDPRTARYQDLLSRIEGGS
jgi:Flp pilus assembly protein TadD